MKHHADALAVIVMMGGEADEAQLREAGADRNAANWLSMMGYIRAVSHKRYPAHPPANAYMLETIIFSITPKGMEYLKNG